jgi:hypothetical protein
MVLPDICIAISFTDMLENILFAFQNPHPRNEMVLTKCLEPLAMRILNVRKSFLARQLTKMAVQNIQPLHKNSV